MVQSTSFNSNSMSAALVSAAAECAATLCVVPEDDVTHEARKVVVALSYYTLLSSVLIQRLNPQVCQRCF